jgi:hypothetical protein
VHVTKTAKSELLLWTLAGVAMAASLAIISISATRAPALTAPAEQTIADLNWMSGDWQNPIGGRARIEEHWTTPAGGTMIGMGRTIVGERTAEFEYLRLEQRADGIFYVASPQAQCPATDFKLTRLSGQEAVFENPQHDFPKRIIYRKKNDGSLVATIDGGEGTKAQSFAYKRMR